MVPELWARIFSFLIGETLFVEHVDLGGACSFLSCETRKSWLSVEEPCIHTTHAVYRQIANVRVEERLLKRFMYSQARRFRKKEERRLAATREILFRRDRRVQKHLQPSDPFRRLENGSPDFFP